MATISYTGNAPFTAQINSVTPGGTIAATDIFTITINGKTISFPATTTTVAHVVTGLQAAFAASTEVEFLEITAADMTTYLKLTANTAGKPFTQTSSINNVSGGAAPTLVTATTTANSGPEQYDLATNWTGTPTNGDTAIVEGEFNLRYGDLSAVTLARLLIRDFTGEIGLPPINAESGYSEYRPQLILISATVCDVLDTNSSQMVRLNFGSVQTLMNVYGTGSAGKSGIAALTWKGTHASNVINVLSGSVGIATEAGEVATVATLRTGEGTNGPAEVEVGIGVTLTTLTQDAGNVNLYADASVVTVNGGVLNLIDDPDIATQLTIRNSTVYVNGGPTIAFLQVSTGGVLDCTRDIRPFTVTNGQFNAGATVLDPYGRATWSNALTKDECDFDQLTLRMGMGKSVAFA